MAASTGKNAIANLAGTLATPLLGVVMTPFYLRQIGLEGLGLVGLMALVSSIVGVFVAGASKTIQRDISHAVTASPSELYSIVQGGLLLFASIAVCLAGAVFLLGESQVANLAAGSSISPEVLRRSIFLISLLFGLGTINGYIASALISLKDQILPNMLGIGMNMLMAVVTWLALSKYPRVDVFYVCQLGGAVVGAIVLGLRCKSIVVGHFGEQGRVKLAQAWLGRLRQSGRLSLILIVHEGLGIFITQIDRMLITALFPLKALGAYNLGANPARLSSIFANPVNAVTFPEMCSMVGSGESPAALGEYLGRLTYLMTLLLSCAVIILLPGAGDLMVLWLGEGQVPRDAADCLMILAIGHLLLGIAGPSYNLTVAFQRVGYGIPQNVIALMVLPILGWYAAKLWGIQGAALTWLLYCLSAVILCTVLAFRRHASISGGAPWLRTSAYSFCIALVIGLSFKQANLSSFQMIGATVGTSLLFLVLSLVRSFGFSITSWLAALDPIRSVR